MVFYKKRRYRMKRRVKKKSPLSRSIQNSFRMFRAKIQAYVSVLPTASATQFDYKNCYPLNFPGNYMDNLGAYSVIPSGVGPLFTTAVPGMLARLMDTFDTYRVASVNVKFMPFAIRVYTATTQDNVSAFASTISYVKDLDDSALISNNSIALNNAVIPLSMNVPSSITYHQPKITRNQWFNCQNYSVTPGAAPLQGNLMPENAYKSVKVWCSNIPVSATANQDVVGRFYITWDVIFKGLNNGLA